MIAFFRALGNAACLLALTIGTLAIAADVPVMLRHGGALATGLADLSLALLVALSFTPLLALAIHLARPGRRLASAIAVFVLGSAATIFFTDALYRPHHTPYLRGSLAFGVALSLLTVVAMTAHRRAVDVALLLLSLFFLALELVAPRALPREGHDLAMVLAVASGLAGLQPLLRWLRTVRGGRIALALAIAASVSFVVLPRVDGWSPGWRTRAWHHAHWQPRLGTLLRALVDLDGDGYSPIAWGGDCNDFDGKRNPAARDHDGIDANCNGTIRPAQPSDADRGLAPAAGNPDAADIDLVVLITIDCMRADSLSPEVTPRLWQLAQSGLSLERLYSAGTHTLQSLPLLLRGADNALPLADRLANKGVTTLALLAYSSRELEAISFQGFTSAHAPTRIEDRWTAAQATEQAIAALDQTSGRTFLWLHYFDAHHPQMTAHPLATPPGRPAEMGQYLGALGDIDAAIGRLRDHLAPRWPRTLFIVTSDHGESFGEHEIPYHRLGAYEAVTRVPGIVAGGSISHASVQSILSHRDLTPTVLGGFGLTASDPSAETFGRSWLRLRAAPDQPLHRFVVVRSTAGTGEGHPVAAIIDSRWKLVDTFENDLVELYDPIADPAELDDQRARRTDVAAQLEKQLALYRDIDGYP